MGREISIGRRAECDLVIDHEVVSRNHCLIGRDQNGLYLVDHSSQNGTYINGKRVAPLVKTPIPEGATVRLGQSMMLPLDRVHDLLSRPEATLAYGSGPSVVTPSGTPSIGELGGDPYLLLSPLSDARGWIKLTGIGLVIQGAMLVLSLWGILVAWLYIWLGVVLISAAGRIEDASRGGDSGQLRGALGNVGRYFSITGVLTLIWLILFGLSVLTVVVLAIFSTEILSELVEVIVEQWSW